MTAPAGDSPAAGAAPAPLVSVVVATFDRAAMLRLALRSLLAQDHADFEGIVVGDACSDDSADVVASLCDPRLQWVNLPRRHGSQYGPNNEGLRRARGRYVAYLGHDDLWLPWHLSSLVRALAESGADLVYDLSAMIAPAGVAYVCGPPPDGPDRGHLYAPPSSWLHRRELLATMGGWPRAEELGRGVDEEMLVRCRRMGARMEAVSSLGVLKFPSPFWGTYALVGESPQRAWLDEMAADARALEHRVLIELATLAARRQVELPTPLQLLARLPRRSASWLLDWLGRDRWPVRPLWRRYYQGVRRRMLRRRGLQRSPNER